MSTTNRTTSSTYDERSNPSIMSGIASASNTDWIMLPKAAKRIVCQTSNNDDEIATCALSDNGQKATFGLVDDEGAAGDTDRNIHWIAYTDPQDLGG